MNAIGRFKIYPRGFLGAPLEPVLEESPDRFDSLGQIQSGLRLFDPQASQLVVANRAIDVLFGAMVRRDRKTTDFRFREDILREVMAAFGTQDFNEWYIAQFKSPSLGQMHRDFLDDMLNFIWGHERRLGNFAWNDLVTPGEVNNHSSELGDRAKKIFGCDHVHQIGLRSQQYGYYSVKDIVQRWCEKEGGISDMLFTAHILFGVTLVK